MATRKIADIRHPTDSQVHVVVRYNAELEEYVCKLYVASGHYAPADYFTNDREDALRTAQTMVNAAG